MNNRFLPLVSLPFLLPLPLSVSRAPPCRPSLPCAPPPSPVRHQVRGNGGAGGRRAPPFESIQKSLPLPVPHPFSLPSSVSRLSPVCHQVRPGVCADEAGAVPSGRVPLPHRTHCQPPLVRAAYLPWRLPALPQATPMHPCTMRCGWTQKTPSFNHPAPQILAKLAAPLFPPFPLLLFSSMQRSSDAHASLQHAMRLDPRNPLPVFQHAYMLLGDERLGDALHAAKQLLHVAAREPSVYFLLGKICKKLDRPEEALMHLNCALDLKPPAQQVNLIKAFIEKLNVPDNLEDVEEESM
ncbi:unnamed protein product [Closterium sp. NIES-54]